jgi:hypothetical protein
MTTNAIPVCSGIALKNSCNAGDAPGHAPSRHDVIDLAAMILLGEIRRDRRQAILQSRWLLGARVGLCHLGAILFTAEEWCERIHRRCVAMARIHQPELCGW